MNAPGELAPLSASIHALQRLIERYDDQGIIIGGVARSAFWAGLDLLRMQMP